MSISVNQLLKNPSGKYSAYFGRRDLIIQNMEDRFYNILKKKKEFKTKIYRDGDSYFYVLKVPSETLEDFYFDVVIEAFPVSEGFKTDFSINNYNVRLFSNSPNFIFTYAYVYNKTDTLIEFLKEKISDRALEEEPKVRNPIESYGYEKSVYFALLYLKEKGLNVKSKADKESKKLDKKEILKEVLDSDAMLKKYNIAKNKEKEQKKKTEKKKKVVSKTVNRKVKLTRR